MLGSDVHDLEQLRHHCAQRLRQKLMDPRVRAEKAAALQIDSPSHLQRMVPEVEQAANWSPASITAPPLENASQCSTSFIHADTSTGSIAQSTQRSHATAPQRRHPAVPPLQLNSACLAQRRSQSLEVPQRVSKEQRSAPVVQVQAVRVPRAQSATRGYDRPTASSVAASRHGGTHIEQEQIPSRFPSNFWGNGAAVRGAPRPSSPPSRVVGIIAQPTQKQGRQSTSPRPRKLPMTDSKLHTNSRRTLPRAASPPGNAVEPNIHKKPRSASPLIRGGESMNRPLASTAKPQKFDAPACASVPSAGRVLKGGANQKVEGGSQANSKKINIVPIATPSDSLRHAGLALRQLIPKSATNSDAVDTKATNSDAGHTKLRSSDSASSVQRVLAMESPTSSASSNVANVANNSAAHAVKVALNAGISRSPEASKNLITAFQQLIEENATLHEAFHDANRRLSQLEEDKSRFFDEDVFDLANLVCNAPPGSMELDSTCQNLVAHLQGLGNGAIRHLRSTAPVAPHFHLPTVEIGKGTFIEKLEDKTPLADSSLPLSETWDNKQRTAALTDENAELRRELTRASELRELLEQQQRAAEDRMHKLELEREWLAQRVSQCMAVVETGNPRHGHQPLDGGTGASASNSSIVDGFNEQSHPVGVTTGSAGSGAQNLDMRRQLAEMSSMLHTKLETQPSNIRHESSLEDPSSISQTFKPTPGVEMSPETPSEVKKRHDLEKVALEKERLMLEEEKLQLSREMHQREDQHEKQHREQRAESDYNISDLDGPSQNLEQSLPDAQEQTPCDLMEEETPSEARSRQLSMIDIDDAW